MGAVTGPMAIRPARPDLEPSHPYSGPAREIAAAARWAEERARVTAPIPVLPEAQGERLPVRRRSGSAAATAGRIARAAWRARGGDRVPPAVLGEVISGLRHLDDAPPPAAEAPAPRGRHAAPAGQDRPPAAAARPPRHDRAAALRASVAAMYRARGLASLGLPGWCPDCGDQPCPLHGAMGRRAMRMYTIADHVASGLTPLGTVQRAATAAGQAREPAGGSVPGE
jgi:hypothetical protein